MAPVLHFFALALFSVGANIAQHAQDKVSLMRAEHRNANIALHLGVTGELVRDVFQPEDEPSNHEKARTSGETINVEADLQKVKLSTKTKTQERDMCDEDFILGEIDDNNCKSGPSEEGADKQHTRTLDREECKEAAILANATMPEAYMLNDEQWFQIHPEGCFAHPCTGSRNASSALHGKSADTPTICYYYNPIGYDEPVPGRLHHHRRRHHRSHRRALEGCCPGCLWKGRPLCQRRQRCRLQG